MHLLRLAISPRNKPNIRVLIMSLNLLNNSVSRCHHPHFSNKETDTQRDKLVVTVEAGLKLPPFC